MPQGAGPRTPTQHCSPMLVPSRLGCGGTRGTVCLLFLTLLEVLLVVAFLLLALLEVRLVVAFLLLALLEEKYRSVRIEPSHLSSEHLLSAVRTKRMYLTKKTLQGAMAQSTGTYKAIKFQIKAEYITD